MSLEAFIRGLPKAELHVHIEGTLEPEMMFDMAERNGVDVAFQSVEATRAAYRFSDLQSFLDIYYQGVSVLTTERDFYDLMYAYLARARGDGVRRAEIFFDAQAHTMRGVGFEVFMGGFTRAMEDAQRALGISSALILCFLRHLGPEAAVATWREAEPFSFLILGVGLDSSEKGIPPGPFAEAYRLAQEAGLRSVVHAGEEGPPAYIIAALDTLGAERIDHGVSCEEDPALVARLAATGVPLTMCPLSNLALRGVDRLEDHGLKRLLNQGVKVTVNSDDPAYFGGYVADNYLAVAEALDLQRSDLVALAANSIEACFLDEASKEKLVNELAAYVAAHGD
ncbi:MAG: adenosine deaminase [Acidimicrobiia bacterium]|nr:adenosine deaminase [Acidimicrobiia bacterium]